MSNKLKNSEFKVRSNEAEIDINKGSCLRTLELVESIRDEIHKQERVKQSEEIREVINNTSEISENSMEVTDVSSKNDDNEISAGSQELNKKFWDIVCLMDYNRQQPGKRVLFIRCGNVNAAGRIISEPRFQVVESLLIHVGVNDTESETCNAVDIANSLKEVALLAK